MTDDNAGILTCSDALFPRLMSSANAMVRTDSLLSRTTWRLRWVYVGPIVVHRQGEPEPGIDLQVDSRYGGSC